VSSAGLAQSPVRGLGKVISLEHPALDSRLVDLPPESNPRQDAARLLAELRHVDGESQVAIREGQRYAARLVRLRPAPRQPIAVRADASYLVTGGLGVLGQHVARWLVDQGARNLVLVGRRSPTTAVNTKLAALETAGVRVETFQADVADEEEMRHVFSAIAESLPPLRGIVHAAGVDGRRPLQEVDCEGFRGVLRPKAAGAWTLHRLTRRHPLDFLVCFSSIASVWGSKAQGSYAAANQFLDAFASYRAAQGLSTLSVNWGPWAGGGMVSKSAAQQLAGAGIYTLFPEPALQALQDVWSCQRSTAVIARVDWRRFKEVVAASARVEQLLEQIESVSSREQAEHATPSAAVWLRRIAEAAAEERHWILEQYLAGELAQVLGADTNMQIEPDRGFFELGMDSLMSVSLKKRLERGLGIHLPATLAFDYPTLTRLTDYLLATHFADTKILNRDRTVPPAGAPETCAQMNEAEAEAALVNKLDQLDY
jgi:NAD(P)-dependent dehydrogenase (short-subunit alcohol dehydrogenase family)